ncbi:MAG: hypothetical protein SFZ23_09520 [Planctomycetota bacterium]|nr:hypothetical protein [Planctomycetota bacterium]
MIDANPRVNVRRRLAGAGFRARARLTSIVCLAGLGLFPVVGLAAELEAATGQLGAIPTTSSQSVASLTHVVLRGSGSPELRIVEFAPRGVVVRTLEPEPTEPAGGESGDQSGGESGGESGGASAQDQNPTSQVVGWHQVLGFRSSVSSALVEAAMVASPWREKLERGEAAWRAIQRVRRGDYARAEADLESLFTTADPDDGPLAVAVADALLRCRLHRNARTGALAAWLGWLSRVDQAEAGSMVSDPEWSSDAATGLSPSLPPIWLATPSVRALASGGGPSPREQQEASPRAARLRALYVLAARGEVGTLTPEEAVWIAPLTTSAFGSGNSLRSRSPSSSDSFGGTGVAGRGVGSAGDHDAGVKLVARIVLARAGDENQRRDSRQALESLARDEESPAWQRSWAWVGVGRSMLRESDPELRMAGVVALLRVASQDEWGGDYLPGLALAEASVALRELGHDGLAVALKRELVDRWADAAPLDWEPLKRLGGSKD